MLSSAQDLLALAHEPSSAQRRDLLSQVTDIFAEAQSAQIPDGIGPDGMGDDSLASVDGKEFSRLAMILLDQFEVDVRAEFAERFADMPGAPADLMSRLAHDVIEVARPVIRRSAVLTEPELSALALVRGPDHLAAIASRPVVSELVSDILVRRGDENTVITLTNNTGARLSREAFAALVERSETIKALRCPLVGRVDVPIDLLNDMMVFVEDELRHVIRRRVSAIPAKELDEALRHARMHASHRLPMTANDVAVRQEIQGLRARNRLTKPIVLDYLRGGDEPRFLAGLAEFLETDMLFARRLWRAETLDALAIAIRANDGDRAFFVSLAMHREGISVRDPETARRFGETFEALPTESSRRTMDFWRISRADSEASSRPQ